MNLQEFKLKKPEFVIEARKCNTKSDFTKLAEKYGIKFGVGCLQEAFKVFCGHSVQGKMSESDLLNVSGGQDESNLKFTSASLGGVNSTTLVTKQN